MAKFPMRFAKGITIGPRPAPGRPAKFTTATATLVRLACGPVAITCHHVVEKARMQAANGDEILFQVGDAIVDLSRQLIDENQNLDIATILLTNEQLAQITVSAEIGALVFEPREWPAIRPLEGAYVAFGGFPGAMRQTLSFRDIEFHSWSVGACRIDSSSDRQFITAFDREGWQRIFGDPSKMDLNILGGLSGGPVFILRGLSWDLVGIIKEYHEGFDAMLFASLERVRSNGTIVDVAF